MPKAWWIRALLGSALGAALTIGAGILHTSVILGGRLTEAEDEALSGKYGVACGIGIVAILVLAYARRGRKTA
jgi:hypothetical protein